MLDLELISIITPRVCLITQIDVKFLTILEKRSLLTELFLHKKNTVQESVKLRGLTRGQTNSIRFSHGTSANRGVFIAIREKLDYVILDDYSHDNGNFLILRVRIQGLPVILVNYYAPNGEKEQVKVLTQIKEFLSKLDYDQNTVMT